LTESHHPKRPLSASAIVERMGIPNRRKALFMVKFGDIRLNSKTCVIGPSVGD
jgi:hypothetical protein